MPASPKKQQVETAPVSSVSPVPSGAAIPGIVAASVLHLEGRTARLRIGSSEVTATLDASVHPFARSMAFTDVRLTTRWEEDDLAMAFYSCLHEFGHGLYERQMDPRHYRTTLAEATGLGVHESQSRLWENLVGRSRPFCEWALPLLRAHLGGPFEAMDVDALYRSVNRVELSLIRIEADETTYNLHIALRFELELALVEGGWPSPTCPTRGTRPPTGCSASKRRR